MIELTATQRQHLRALAHPKQPVVMIGDKGLTAPVLKEIERALTSHALIKIKAASDERGMREAWLKEICIKLGASPVQHLGKILVIYRPSETADIILAG
ncbi:MAG: YhbY family RNA-binding protein [Thiobacillaceae bacterium]